MKPEGQLSTAYKVIDVMEIEALGFVAVALTPAIPNLSPGSAASVHVHLPSGVVRSATAIVEYRKRPPVTPVLLRFDGWTRADIPVGSEIRFLSDDKARP